MTGGAASGFRVDPPPPPGLVLDPLTGRIFGLPREPGTTRHELRMWNGAGETTVPVEITIAPFGPASGD